MVCGIGCLFFPGAILADEALLPSDHGYMLIRLNLSPRERVDQFAISNVDTSEVFRIHTRSFEPAGLNAWIAMVALPKGRYFLSEYQPRYGITTSEMQSLPTKHRRSAPDTASDTFEIVPGAVNYVGDWTLRIDASRRARLSTTVEFDKSTLERYVTQYPEHSSKYSIYLSVMGEKAISLDELVKPAE
jgi:hypothetical protein